MALRLRWYQGVSGVQYSELRRYGIRRHFISKLTHSDADQLETQYSIETALTCSYTATEEADILLNEPYWQDAEVHDPKVRINLHTPSPIDYNC